jgi:hypothetical protein
MRDARPTGDVAAHVFTLFDEQVHVIQQVRVAPDLVDSLHQHWSRLRQSLNDRDMLDTSRRQLGTVTQE